MIDEMVALTLFALAAAISPGGATVLVTSSGARFGLRRSLPLIAGIVTGMVALMAASAVGLAAALQALPSIELVLRIAGTAYMLWLAWKVASAPSPAEIGSRSGTPDKFTTGILLLWLNPKAWTMGVAAAATYASVADSAAQLAVVLAAVFGLAALSSLVLWCTAGVALRRLLRTPAQWRWVNGALGLLLTVTVLLLWRS